MTNGSQSTAAGEILWWSQERNSRYGMKTREVQDLASELESKTEGPARASKL